MKRVIAFLCLIFANVLAAESLSVDGLRLWTAPDHTRLVFDTSGAVEHAIFSLTKPHRLVVDLKSTRLNGKFPDLNSDDPYIRQLRSGTRNDGDLRLVLDLKQPVRPKSFVLRPNSKYGHRLVVDLYADEVGSGKKPKVTKTLASNGLRDVVVAVDAGHGGEDVGAIGYSGLYEKKVALAIARKLKALIDAEPGMRAVMTRDGDYYISLRKRMEIARKERADLFVSIHADAFRDPRVSGMSVYTLSNRGASSEAARWLAESENSADLIGGVTLDDKDDVLASVLLDLSQTATKQASSEVADRVFRQLRRVGKVHSNRVQQAGFVVLKSPDVPSLLVETAFISNRAEERKLKDPRHQKRVAKALMKGIRTYFHASPPPGTRLAAAAKSRQHVIAKGDTLSAIARRYHVSLADLRTQNGLGSDRIRVGQVLHIPGS